MPAFKFKSAQHVTVPGLNVPGRVLQRIDTAGAENAYRIAFLNDTCAVTDDLFGERDLIAAQPITSDATSSDKTPLPDNELTLGKGKSSKRRTKR